MLALILASILNFAKDTARALFILARQAWIALRVVRGHVAAGILMQARGVLLQIVLWTALFSALQLAWIGLRFLFGNIADWTGLVETVRNLGVSSNQGVFYVVWRSLDLDSAFNACSSVFLAWVSGWGVYKSLEYTSVISSMTKARGFWSRI